MARLIVCGFLIAACSTILGISQAAAGPPPPCAYGQITLVGAPTLSGANPSYAEDVISSTGGSWTSCNEPFTGYYKKWVRSNGTIASGPTWVASSPNGANFSYTIQKADAGYTLTSAVEPCNADGCYSSYVSSSNSITVGSGWGCGSTVNQVAGYKKTTGVPSSLSGNWTVSSATETTSGQLYVEASLASSDYYIDVLDLISRIGTQYTYQPYTTWAMANGSGDYSGTIHYGLPFNGSFNFARQGDGTYKVYLDGILTASSLSFGGETLNLAQYDFNMYPTDPCTVMDGTWTTSTSLSGATPLTARDYVLHELSSTEFEVYTKPF